MVTHELRLYSLDNGFSDEDIAEFLARIRRYLNLADDAPITMTAEDKIDGLSLSIRYEGGKRSEEHTSELQSLMRNSYAVFCLKKKKKHKQELIMIQINTIVKYISDTKNTKTI